LDISEESYELKSLGPEHFKDLFNWILNENNYEYFTCRPVLKNQNSGNFTTKLAESINDKNRRWFVLTYKEDSATPLGKINLFDYNSRNHSAEFGYYFPECNRSKGFGSIMLKMFLKEAFDDKELNINKLYATTSSNNTASIRLLEKHGFKLDGRMREHYWIGEDRFDQLAYSILKAEWECTKTL
jgi:Acetyltransferases, including N-acetylases of ribosomal proteins